MTRFPVAELERSPTAFPFPRTRDDLNDRVQAFKLAHDRDPSRICFSTDAEAYLVQCKVLSAGRPETFMGLEVVWDAPSFDLW
jgi:hypothetical protein